MKNRASSGPVFLLHGDGREIPVLCVVLVRRRREASRLRCVYRTRKSSIDLPDASAWVNHPGRLPRPVQVLPALSR